MNRVKVGMVLSLVASATPIGCGDPLVAPELITNARVLAARSESANDANRAWAMPAEAMRVRWLVADPNGPVPLAWSFSACVAESVSRGLPICAAAPFSQFTSRELSTSEPEFAFTMPHQADLGSATQVAISAVFCSSGAPTLGAPGVELTNGTCADASEKPLLATVNVQALLGGASNANPDFARVLVEFDDQEWPAWNDAQAPSVDCTDPALAVPRVTADGASHTLGLAIPTDLSEPLPQLTAHSAARETLSLAHFTTAGDLERAYSEVTLATDPAQVRLSWKAPVAVAASGRLVRFYFVLRDGRGGTDFTERVVCVV